MYQRWHDATAVIHLLKSSNIKCKIMQSSDGMNYLTGSYCVNEWTDSLASCTTWVEFMNASSLFNWKVFVNSSSSSLQCLHVEHSVLLQSKPSISHSQRGIMLQGYGSCYLNCF